MRRDPVDERRLAFPIGPGGKVSEGRASILSPEEGRSLHGSQRADAGDAFAGELLGQNAGAASRGGEADGGDAAEPGINGVQGVFELVDGFDVNEAVAA